jgi:hypothetical protein
MKKIVLVFTKDMPIYQHGNNEPFKVDILEGRKFNIEPNQPKLLVFGYCDWMSGTLAMDIDGIIADGYAVIETEQTT